MDVFLMIATVIIAITLIGIVLLQGQGSGLGTAFGGDAGIHRTASRRGKNDVQFDADAGVSLSPAQSGDRCPSLAVHSRQFFNFQWRSRTRLRAVAGN